MNNFDLFLLIVSALAVVFAIDIARKKWWSAFGTLSIAGIYCGVQLFYHGLFKLPW